MDQFGGIIDVVSGDKPIQVEVDTSSIKTEIGKAMPLLILGSMLLIVLSVVTAMAIAKRLS